MKNILTAEETIIMLRALQKKEKSIIEISKWATTMHFEYEKGNLTLEKKHEDVIFDLLIELIHAEDGVFALSENDIQAKIDMLENI